MYRGISLFVLHAIQEEKLSHFKSIGMVMKRLRHLGFALKNPAVHYIIPGTTKNQILIYTILDRKWLSRIITRLEMVMAEGRKGTGEATDKKISISVIAKEIQRVHGAARIEDANLHPRNEDEPDVSVELLPTTESNA